MKQDIAQGTKYAKESLLQAKVFANRKDALQAVVKEGEFLTLKEATARLDGFMKGKVQ